MRLGPEWVGVIGAGVGGLLGVGGTLAAQLVERVDRRQEGERIDHLRDIDLRRERYDDVMPLLTECCHLLQYVERLAQIDSLAVSHAGRDVANDIRRHESVLSASIARLRLCAPIPC